MPTQLSVEDVFDGIRMGIYDGEMPFYEDFREAIAPDEDYTRLLARELPSLDSFTRAMVVLEFARARHPEALPHAIPLLSTEDGSTRLLAAVAAALLGDSRGVEEIRRQIVHTPPEVSIYHLIEYLEEATLNGQHPELQPLLEQAHSARSRGGG